MTALVNGKSFNGELKAMTGDWTLIGKNGQKTVFHQSDSLMEKLTTPIMPGAFVTGVMLVNIPGVVTENVKFGDVSITLWIEDLFHHSASASIELARSLQGDEMKLFPGLHPDVSFPGANGGSKQ